MEIDEMVYANSPQPLWHQARCSCKNLKPDDLRRSRGGDPGAGERLQIQVKLHSLACRLPPALRPGS